MGLLQAANIAGCVAGSLLVGLLGLLHRSGTTGSLRVLLLAGLASRCLGLRTYGGRAVFVRGRPRCSALLAVLLPGQGRALAAPARR